MPQNTNKEYYPGTTPYFYFYCSIRRNNQPYLCVALNKQQNFTVYNILWSQIYAVASSKVKSNAALDTVCVCACARVCVCVSESKKERERERQTYRESMFFAGWFFTERLSQESLILAIRDFLAHAYMHTYTHTHKFIHVLISLPSEPLWCVCVCVSVCSLMRGYQSSHDRGNPVQWQVWISQLVCVCLCVTLCVSHSSRSQSPSLLSACHSLLVCVSASLFSVLSCAQSTVHLQLGNGAFFFERAVWILFLKRKKKLNMVHEYPIAVLVTLVP